MKVHRSPLGLLVVVCTSLAVAETRLVPPVAPRIEHREDAARRSGRRMTTSGCARNRIPTVIEYLDAENAYTEAMTERPEGARRNALPGDARPHQADRPDRSHAPRRLLLLLADRRRPAVPDAVPPQGRCMDAPEEVLLDLNELAKGHDFFASGQFVVSDDGNLLAYTTDTTGFRQIRAARQGPAQRRRRWPTRPSASPACNGPPTTRRCSTPPRIR